MVVTVLLADKPPKLGDDDAKLNENGVAELPDPNFKALPPNIGVVDPNSDGAVVVTDVVTSGVVLAGAVRLMTESAGLDVDPPNTDCIVVAAKTDFPKMDDSGVCCPPNMTGDDVVVAVLVPPNTGVAENIEALVVGVAPPNMVDDFGTTLNDTGLEATKLLGLLVTASNFGALKTGAPPKIEEVLEGSGLPVT